MTIPLEIFDKTKERFLSARNESTFIRKMKRLKVDLQTFKEDIEFLSTDDSNRIIYACDYTEVRAYQRPEENIYHYLYDIEEDRDLRSDTDLYKQKVIKRWYRLRELFFNEERKTLIFPSHLEEVEDDILFLYQIRSQEKVKLSEIVRDIKNLKLSESEFGSTRELLEKMEIGHSLTDQESDLLKDFFKKFAPKMAAYTYNKKFENALEYDTRMQRLNMLMKRGNSEDISSYPWEQSLGIDLKTAEKIRSFNIEDHGKSIDQLFDLYNLMERRDSRHLAGYRDAQALIYIHEINNILQDAGRRDVKIQMVSSALVMFDIYNAFPDHFLLAHVRHPKFLAACLSAKENIWRKIKEDQSNIIDSIGTFLDKFEGNKKSVRIIKGDDRAANLRHKISDAWQRLENAIFARELNESENNPKRESIIIEDIKNKKKEKIFNNFLIFLQGKQSGFDSYFHQTFRVVFEDLIDVYLRSFLSRPVEKFNAKYFDGIQNPSPPFRVLVESPGMRKLIEFHDSKIIQTISKGESKGQSFGEIFKNIMDDDSIIDNKFELKLVKAIFMATEGKWQIVKVLCDYALEDKRGNMQNQEAFFLRHLARRKLAIEAAERNKEAEGAEFFRQALEDLEAAEKKKGAKDFRFILAHAAMGLEGICYPALLPGRNLNKEILGLHLKINICEKELTYITINENSSFNKYMIFRYYETFIIYYFTCLLRKVGPVDKNKVKIEKARKWFDGFLRVSSELKKMLDFPRYRGATVIKNGGILLFDFDKLDENKCIQVFDKIVASCRKMMEAGFFWQLTHELKIYLLMKIIEKYPNVENEAKSRWPKVYEGFIKVHEKSLEKVTAS